LNLSSAVYAAVSYNRSCETCSAPWEKGEISRTDDWSGLASCQFYLLRCQQYSNMKSKHLDTIIMDDMVEHAKRIEAAFWGMPPLPIEETGDDKFRRVLKMIEDEESCSG